MLKVILYLATAGFVLLFVATALLAWLNWSEKLYMPLITALLVGTVTGFISIFAGLRATSSSESFPTSLVVNRETGSVLITFQESPGSERALSRQSDLNALLSQATGSGPSAVGDITQPLLEALQYYVVRVMSEIGGEGWLVSVTGQTASAEVSTAAPSAALQDYPKASLAKALEGNRFVNLSSEKFWWDRRNIRLPSGATLELYNDSSSSTGKVTRLGVRLRKPAFFVVNIQLEPMGVSSGLPDGLKVAKAEQPKAGTFFAKVSIHSEFERLTSGNDQTPKYKQWANWLSEQLRLRLADRPIRATQ